MNNLMKTMMLMMAMVAVTVRGQNMVTLVPTSAAASPNGQWVTASTAGPLTIDASNNTCAMTDAYFDKAATPAASAVLTVTYPSSFTANTIYLIAPNFVPADMTVAATFSSVTWGPSGSPVTCNVGTAFTATNNVGSWTCATNPAGTTLIVTLLLAGGGTAVQKLVIICNVMIYSNDAAFTTTTTTTVTTTTARAAVTTAKGAKFLRSDLTLMLLGMVAATLKLATGAFGH